MKIKAVDTTIPTLGPLRVPSPIKRGEKNALRRNFVNDTDKVVLNVNVNTIMKMVADWKELTSFELAGPI